jgi:hypothetical protein
MFTTQTLFATLFNSVPSGWTPPKPKPKPKPTFVTPQPKQFSLYTFHIEDYHTHF